MERDGKGYGGEGERQGGAVKKESGQRERREGRKKGGERRPEEGRGGGRQGGTRIKMLMDECLSVCLSLLSDLYSRAAIRHD